jgi:adenine-specific DNA-methyltransferase
VTAVADTPALRKARGAFFTPPALSRYVAEWAVREPDDLVLEPSCGESAFLLAAGERLGALRGGPPRSGQLSGVELHDVSARRSRDLLTAAGLSGSVITGDFFHFPPRACYNAVIGNPPYVRYQDFVGVARAVSREAALAQGVRLTGLASSWAAFTVHASLFLRPGGRLGLVLPAELLSVNYAAEVRAFLMRRFARVRLVMFKERVFPEVQEEVVLLLAEGQGPTDHCELLQLADAAALEDLDHMSYSWSPPAGGGKWTPALLSTEALDVYRTVEAGNGYNRLGDWGRITLGAVTGNNKFFALPQTRVDELGLQEGDLVPLSPPGSRHLRAGTLTLSGWRQLRSDGQSAVLFRPCERPSGAARAYIAAGEATGVHETYKCRVRDIWWRVPLSPVADLLLTYMNAGAVQMATNRAGLRHLNSVHGVVLHPTHRQLGRDLLALASLNSMTLLGAELVGRAYGGGMLKLEPREADVLPVPEPALLSGMSGLRLRDLRPRLTRLLRGGRLEDAVDIVDQVLLVGGVGMTAKDAARLAAARRTLVARRATRGRSVNRTGR